MSLLYVLFSCTCGFAVFEFKETGARGVGVSGAFTARANDATAPFWNPAALRLVPQVELASFYAQLFSVSELTYLGASFALPTPLGGTGFAFSQFGPSAFREHQVYISHGIALMENVYAGYNLKGMFLKIEEFGSAATFGLDASVLTQVRENLNVAMVGKNINRPAIGASKEPLPTGFVVGIAFRPIKGLWLTGDFERLDPNPVALKTGIEFLVAHYFSLRGGMQNNPARFSGGFGAKAGIVQLDYAYLQQGNLSGNHQFTVTFKFGEAKEEVYKMKGVMTPEYKTVPKGEGMEKEELQEPIDFPSLPPVQPTPTTSEEIVQETPQLDINQITSQELSDMGLSSVQVKNILRYRRKKGRFESLEELKKLPGIDAATFEKLKVKVAIQ